MQILKQIREILRQSDLSFNEVKVFESIIVNFDIVDQVELYRLLNYEKGLIYPVFVSFLAKKKAREEGFEWNDAVEETIKTLDNYFDGKVVGKEIA